MNVLAVNCGSSSLKVRLVAAARGEQRTLAHGNVGGIGAGARLTFQAGEEREHQQQIDARDHAAAVRAMLDRLRATGLQIDASGHRVVHGGDRFEQPARIDPAVLTAIEEASALAPLHNAPALAAIRAVRAALGDDVPAVATFDTLFHRTMPPEAARYPIPQQFAERHHLRRYGFHGLAHQWMTERHAALSGIPAERAKIVTLQLGSGCSACAVDGGRSVETTMGLTPLEGLMMGTRSGNVDPALAGLVAHAERRDVSEIIDLLNHRSGLLGVSGRTQDARDLLQARAQGDEPATLALAMFCHRVRMAIGAYLAVLGGANALVFGGGIGEHAPALRAEICGGFAWAGLTLDAGRNANALGQDACISTDDATLHAYVVAVDEEALIVRDTLAVLDRAPGRGM